MKHGHSAGGKTSKEYNAWANMIARCENPKYRWFYRYGGRGIRICSAWRGSFSTFLTDMGTCPANLTLDRIDNDGDYEPSNCRWATCSQQARNRRDSGFLTAFGKTKSYYEWSAETGLSVDTLKDRKHKGWEAERILSAPVVNHAQQTHCKRGHLLAGDNLCKTRRHRICRICYNQAAREGYHRRRQPTSEAHL